ncbi:MAG: winged helix-turn-helix domain-containing protein [Pseudomonadota bacterium]
MAGEGAGPYWIGRCRIDPARNVVDGPLAREGGPDRARSRASGCSLEPKVMAVLCLLAGRAGEVVERRVLLDEIWRHQAVADESLTRAISVIRKTFRRFDSEPVIETIPKRGYRLVAPVRWPERSFARGTKAAGAAVSPVPEHSIAVLAFADLSPGKDQEHLADGVAEEILNALTAVSQLKVSGRTSSFSFKGRNADIREIAETLHVAYVLEGSLRLQGETARITAQLIDREGYHLWSQTFDRDRSDLFRLQEEIARAITDQIVGIVADGADAPQPSVPLLTTSTGAYDLFVKGRDLTHKLNGQTTIPAGIALLEQAVKLDPAFAEAWAWLGLAHFILPEFSRTEDWHSHIEQSRDAIATALALAPECSMALLVQALQTTYDHRVDEALAIYERAVTLDPNNVETIAGFGLGMLAIGRHDRAREAFDRVLQQDPLCGLWHTVYGGIELNAGAFLESERYFRQSFELGFGAAAFGVAHRLAQRGEGRQALRFLRRNHDGLAPVEQAELSSAIVRDTVYRAYLMRPPVARFLTALALKRRLRNRLAQPTSASVISFLFLEEPAAFLANILEKPNPYLGYTIARIWEPTRQSQLVREHRDFPAFAEALGLNRAWACYGQPLQPSLGPATVAGASGTSLTMGI